MTDLVKKARALFEKGKGFLAVDESVHTATERLAMYGISAGEEMRRQYRELFLGANDIEKYLSGAILFPETLLQIGEDGKAFPESLIARGIATGVKVDTGTEPFSESPSETITQGLLDLEKRLVVYREQGAIFTKWRAVIRIDGDVLPSSQALYENAKRLAAYAKETQAAGLVPILEPEVLSQGAHSRTRSREVLIQTMSVLFSALKENAIDPASIILKTSMILSGTKSGKQDMSIEVAEDTVTALLESVPRQIAGIIFLSGGQTPDQATNNLIAILQKADTVNVPWPLTFSFARALQEEALSVWRGKKENVFAARSVFLARLSRLVYKL